MTTARKQRLMLLVFVIFGVTTSVALALVALQENINLYYSPVQMAEGNAPVGKFIRGGGLVLPGSIKRDDRSLKVRFQISDGDGVVTIHYEGILPDLFMEGQGVVASGKLDESGVFLASEILGRHRADYMPPEVKDAIDKIHARTKDELLTSEPRTFSKKL